MSGTRDICQSRLWRPTDDWQQDWRPQVADVNVTEPMIRTSTTNDELLYVVCASRHTFTHPWLRRPTVRPQKPRNIIFDQLFQCIHYVVKTGRCFWHQECDDVIGWDSLFHFIVLFQATRSIQKKQQTERKDRKNSTRKIQKTQNTQKKQSGQKVSIHYTTTSYMWNDVKRKKTSCDTCISYLSSL